MSEMSTDEFLLPTNKDDSEFEKDEFDALASLASDDLTDAVYTGWDMTSAGDDEPLPGNTGNAAVYGLDEKATKDARKADEVQKDRKMPVAVIAGIAIALLGCGGLVAYRQMAAKPEPAKPASTTTPAVTQPKVTAPKVQQPAVEVLDVDAIQAIINGSFMYGEEDITIDPSRVIVEVRDGRVLVTHQLNEDDVPDAARLVRMAGIRANVLANMLGGKNVSPVAGEQGMGIVDVTWVVRDANGDAFVAVSDVPGDIRTSDDPYGVLKGSQGFVIAPEVLAALGPDTGLEEAFGNAPADLDGSPIAAAAKLAAEKTEDATKKDEKTKSTSSDTSGTENYDDEEEDDGNTGGGGNNHQSVTPTPTPTPEPTPTPTPEPTPSTPTDGGEGGGTGGGSSEGGSSTGGETGGETGGSGGGTGTDG